MKKSYTLAEILVVVIIIAVMVIFAVPGFRKTVESTRDKEAKTMLVLLRVAEKIYRLEYYTYISCANTNSCNQELKLSLPASASSYWTYSVTLPAADQFCASANHGGDNWYISEIMEEAGGACSH